MYQMCFFEDHPALPARNECGMSGGVVVVVAAAATPTHTIYLLS